MEGWTPAPDRPGYRCKTVQRGAANITIYRPIITEAETAKIENQTRAALEGVMREYIQRRNQHAGR